MSQPRVYTFTASPEGDSVTVSYAKYEGVACRFNRVDGAWSAMLVPGGLDLNEATAALDEWRANGGKCS